MYTSGEGRGVTFDRIEENATIPQGVSDNSSQIKFKRDYKLHFATTLIFRYS